MFAQISPSEIPTSQLFSWIDWMVVFGYLVLTTVVGHLMRGKQATIRDFFLAGKSLPWPAVCGSMIATEVSGVTFIGVAGSLFAVHGNFTYIIWGIGSLIGRCLVAWWFVPRLFEKEIYSPYDFMGNQLGKGVKQLATGLFMLGNILGQSVRVMVAAIPLQVCTGLPFVWCIAIIGVFAIGWALMGGLRTVIWTDVMQFFLFAGAAITALLFILSHLQGGWGGFWADARALDRTHWLDLRITGADGVALSSSLQFTLWVALVAVPFQNLTAFGVDQLNAQRMFCCGSVRDARLALVWSNVGQVLTLLMLLVGAALVVRWHQEGGFSPAEAATVMKMNEADPASAAAALADRPLLNNPNTGFESAVHSPDEPDYVFPMWIVRILPVGLSGLILAGVFAAAISSLDSILGAFSQTTLGLFVDTGKLEEDEHGQRKLLWWSRMLVIGWGIVLTGFTFLLYLASEGIPILPLAFGMTAYTFGPLLGLMICALWGRGSLRGLLIGVGVSLLLVMFLRTDAWILVDMAGLPIEWLGSLPTLVVTTAADGSHSIRPVYFFGWAWPVTAILTTICGVLIPGSHGADGEN